MNKRFDEDLMKLVYENGIEKKNLTKLKKSQETLRIKSDLKAAFEEVELWKLSKGKKQTLTDFLNKL